VGAIAIITAETWLGFVCPLTTLEMWLRTQARTPTYRGSFISHWLQRLLYYDLPPWVFLVAYTLFGLLVLGAWIYFPPGRRSA
jgi:polyferredoxin